MDTLAIAFKLAAIGTTTVNGELTNPNTPHSLVYLVEDYIFSESSYLGMETVYQLTDFKKGKYYRHSDSGLDTAEISILIPGLQRGWIAGNAELISSEVIEELSFQGFDCRKYIDIIERDDPLKRPLRNRKPSYYYRCRIPALEALPEQTRLHLHFYKEWMDPDYPVEAKHWNESYFEASPEGDPQEEIITTFTELLSVDTVPMPWARIKEIFGKID